MGFELFLFSVSFYKETAGFMPAPIKTRSAVLARVVLKMEEDEKISNGVAVAGGTDNAAGKSEKVCSLCGDIGFLRDLVLCRNCGFRLQHTYCSRFYPYIDMETWRCEWCLHDEEKRAGKRNRVFEFLLEIAQSLPAGDGDDARQADVAGNDEKRIRRRDGNDRRPTGNQKSGLKLTGNPKRHKALDRWRKLNCNSSSKVIGRRYKLLADVLC